VDPRVGTDGVKKKFLTLPRFERRLLGRPSRTYSVAIPSSYPGSIRLYSEYLIVGVFSSVRLHVLMVMAMNIIGLWDVTPCSLVDL
jgi:hypothetical protein